MSLWSAIAAVAITATVLFGVTQVGIAASESARARSAADSAALAGAAAGPSAAQRSASINGARLVSISFTGARTRVVVEVEGSSFAAVAERFLVPAR